jgi:hypothetical protein
VADGRRVDAVWHVTTRLDFLADVSARVLMWYAYAGSTAYVMRLASPRRRAGGLLFSWCACSVGGWQTTLVVLLCFQLLDWARLLSSGCSDSTHLACCCCAAAHTSLTACPKVFALFTIALLRGCFSLPVGVLPGAPSVAVGRPQASSHNCS